MEWTWTNNPESIGRYPAKLALAQAHAGGNGLAAVMVIDNGFVVASRGNIMYKYPCHSMYKNLISALYGIYITDGKIDLAQTLSDFGIYDLTPLTEVEKTAAVADLLSARLGVYIEAASMKALRPVCSSHAPGTFWYYTNWDFNAPGTTFDQLSGQENIYTAFGKRIANPIGMQDYDPTEFSYTHESYSRHPYYGFRMSTRDLVRAFGFQVAERVVNVSVTEMNLES